MNPSASHLRRRRNALRFLLDKPAVGRRCNICGLVYNPLAMPGSSWVCPTCGPAQRFGAEQPGCTPCDPRFDLCPIGATFYTLIDAGRPRRPVAPESWGRASLPRWVKTMRVRILFGRDPG